ncbi:MAG: 2-isopropylmalate synthase [Phycisphaerae bacterium]|nr:2-isopropylmalate synthase [Phycisphaerae bacterium]
MTDVQQTDSDQPIVRIFDTTLRDGEQSPGASLNRAAKLEIARKLERLGVDIIEAGFPITSNDDFEAVKAISGEVSECTVAGLARCVEKDILRAAEAVREARHPRIHVFCATSKIHREHKLKRAREEILKMSVEGVKLAKRFVEDVEFSPEDASRTEIDFLAEVVEATIAAGATTVNIPDTVGYTTPERFHQIITELRERVANIDQAVISVHCHNDLGLAVANSLSAILAGARQVECTINGIGERAGNAALEEIVMALKVRNDHYGATTRIETARLYPLSRTVASLTGISVQRNKAIVGRNAFAHEAGIHQHGVMQHAETYEIMRPEDVGVPASELVLGKHSGRHAFRDRLEQLGHRLNDEQIDEAFVQFKELADKKKEVFDEDIDAIVEGMITEVPVSWEIVSLQTTAGGGVIATATIRLRDVKQDRIVQDAATGDGPVDAVYSVIQRITGVTVKLKEYELRAITGGKEAQAEVLIKVQQNGRTVRGRAYSVDIVEASAKAYLNAINTMIALEGVSTEAPEGV